MKKHKMLTRKVKTRLCKGIAIMLSLTLLLQTVALADDVIPNSTAEISTSAPVTEVEAVEENEEIDISDLEIVSEDESKRGEAEKHFLCEDGSYVAISYATPVHYEDEDGDWQEIDNTLEAKTVNGVTAYTNTDGLFDVALSPSGENIVTIEKDGYTVSFDVTAKTDASLIAEKILDNKLPAAYVSALFTKTEVVSGGTLSPIQETEVALAEIPAEAIDTRLTAVNGIINSYNLQDKEFAFTPKEAEIKATDTSLWSQAEKLTTLTKTNSQISFTEAFEEDIG